MKFFAAVLATALPAAAAFSDADFEKRVRPLLVKHCVPCHGVVSQAKHLAERVMRDVPEDDDRIRRLFLLAYARPLLICGMLAFGLPFLCLSLAARHLPVGLSRQGTLGVRAR